MPRTAVPPRRQQKKRAKPELIVSLDEFASICSVTPETMRKHLVDAPADAPWMIERGRRGVSFKIAAPGAVSWWKSRSTGGDPEDDERRSHLAEWRLMALGDGGDDEGFRMTGSERSAEFQAGIVELKYREAIGELVKAATIYEETVNAVIELRRQLLRVAPEIRRELGLDKDAELAIEEKISDRLAAFVTKLGVDVAAGN